jgi:Zn-dependent protease
MTIGYLELLFIGAWFVQMGAHEGAHAYVADYLGDDTAKLLGKKSFNPLVHVNWDSFNSILMSVLFPIFTALNGLVPMGMAWVPVNPRRFRRVERDMALTSFAGPAANFAVVLLCLLCHILLGPVLGGNVEASIFDRFFFILDEFFRVVCYTSALYGFFNLIPLPPLDGSKVLRFFLPPAGKEIMDNMEPYGFWILMALFWVGDAGVIIRLPMQLVSMLWQAV